MRIIQLSLLSLFAVVPTACERPQSHDPAVGEVAEFALSQEPEVSIGVIGGSEEYQLYRVRSAFQLRNGSVVIADGTTRLRYYDEQGRHMRTVGREGRGPGEFMLLRYARAIRGDTVVTWDLGQRRVSFFDDRGDLAHEFTIDLTDHTVQVGDVSIPARPLEMVSNREGLLLFQSNAPFRLLSGHRPDGTRDPGFVAPDGVYRLSHTLFVLDRGGSIVQKLGPVPAMEWFLRGGTWQFRFWGHRFYLAGGGEMFGLGSGKPHSFLMTAGRKLRPVDTGIPGTAVHDDVWEERLQRTIQLFPDDRDRIRDTRAMPKPDTLPAYSALLMDDEDRVWVQEFDPAARAIWYAVGVAAEVLPGPSGPRYWSVFGPDGVRVGRLEIPRNIRLTDIYGDRVTAVVHDELGVERVQVFALEQRN